MSHADREIEAKFLDVDAEDFRRLAAGAPARRHVRPVLMRRKLYDFPDLRLRQAGSWLRLRDEGGHTTLALKSRADGDRTVGEIQVPVGDFAGTTRILAGLGLVEVAEQETRRESWEIGPCLVTLDEWPGLPPFVEIEGPSEREIRTVCGRLGLGWDEAVWDTVDGVYERYYPGTRAAISGLSLTFASWRAELGPARAGSPDP